jgi:uncharacterized membrane-anchored protein
MKFRLLIAALVLPIMALIASAVMAWREDQRGVSWDLPVAGRDPLDVLRGHYVVFDYAWPEQATSRIKPGSRAPSWRLCLSGAADDPDIQFFTDGDSPAPVCTSVGKMIEDHHGLSFRQVDDMGRPRANGQLFIPEADGPRLNQLLQNRLNQNNLMPIRARVRIAPDGKVTPVDIIVEGKSYRETPPP